MFLPFHADTPTARVAWVNYALIAANGIVFVWLLQLTPQQYQSVTLHHGFIPARIGQLVDPRVITIFQDEPARLPDGRFVVDQQKRQIFVRRKIADLPPDRGAIVLSLLTCMFLHGGLWHVLSNMWFLWIFGNHVEGRLSHVPYLLFYLVGGLSGSACHWLIDPSSTTPVIGASGAVAAVLGGYAITWPWARVHTVVWLVVFITVIDVPALGVLGVWFLIQLIQAHGQLGLNVAGGVAWWAHVGGFVAGMVLMPALSFLLSVNRSSGPPDSPNQYAPNP
ncbi:MAG TPA: rhomboid family intramembrane serine protease [Planctomycetaceae bacterium]|nr:rhomboid family intramembrane serine protease [Planctomycetaceae bacterium]